MNASLQFGTGQTLHLEGIEHESPAPASERPDASVEARTRAALLEPIDYPPLAAWAMEGDHVALAVGAGLPCVAEIVAGCLASLFDAGVRAEHIAVVAADDADTRHLLAELADSASAGVQFVTHAPGEDDQLSFAGVTRADREVTLNRLLLDADVMIPLSCAQPRPPSTAAPESLAVTGVYDGLFPHFSDAQSLQQLRETPISPTRLNEQFATLADEVGWLIGAAFVVQVTPGINGEVHAVNAGPAAAVAVASGAQVDRLWRRRVPRRAGLVIATLTGGARQQTWANLGRALATAGRLVTPGGAIALCTALAEPLAEPLIELLAASDPDEAIPALLESELPSADIAAKLLHAREQGPVYLMSRLDPETIEEIGLAPVADEIELNRLASRCEGCVVIEGAQHAVVELMNED